MRGISKTFPGVKALDQVDLEVRPGEVHALLGENGAGKSTLIKVLGGVHKPDAGTITIDNQPVRFDTTRDAEEAGIAIIHQELNLVPQMTVAENIYLGREPQSRWGFVRFKKMHRDALAELSPLDTRIQPGRPISEYNVGQQQLVEIAKALSMHARVVVMDEPTSALSDQEVENLFRVIRSLRDQQVAIIYISHKLDEIFTIADRVSVLRDGRSMGTRVVSKTDSSELVRLMVGRKLDDFFPKQSTQIGEEVLRVSNLSVRHPQRSDTLALDSIDLHLHRGEILGIAGLMGAGRSELLMTLFGNPPGERVSGVTTLHSEPVDISSPVDAINHGLGLVTEDRKLQGLFLRLAVKTNITITSLNKTVAGGLLRPSREEEMARDYIDRLKIKVPGLASAVETLSGGNQQKIILAKWLLTDPLILLLDEPTRGIDVGAKAEIYQLINRFVQQGLGIVMVSSELPELLALCDRIMVLCEGRKTAEFQHSDASEEKIMTAATQSRP
jgi:ABC-type sugar transport system ATPase subunit